MSTAQRLFFGLPLTPLARQELAKLQAALRARAPVRAHLRWLGIDNLHVTLKFLGEVDSSRLPEIEALLERAVAKVGPIPGSVESVTAFPSTHAARVTVARLADPSGWLERLSARLESLAAEHGFARDARSFVPHITLARLSTPTSLHAWLDAFATPATPLLFEQVCLYRSEPGPAGNRYKVVSARSLAPSGAGH
ncbi:MAG TPA: RNA 2',3'-cyclic phosphodiesterase [Polyangiaceae bacterium]|nr:RNA 2',3'-cyclic phosphodiesterase [Polyangiaceae bacterium]